MKVLFISTNTTGGAGLSAYRLHRALIDKGAESLLLVKNKNIDDQTIIGPKAGWEKFYHKLWYRLDKLPAKFFKTNNKNLHSPALFSSLSLKKVFQINPDIVHLRWVCGGFVSPFDVAKINKKYPLVWELSDAWPFCGANHFAEDDLRWRDGYRAGNRPEGESGFDLNRWAFKRKQRAWKNLQNITIACQSHWMADRARASLLFKNYEVVVIPVGIDENIFRPAPDKEEARKKLNLPLDKKIILFGAADAAADKKKGFAYLLEASKKLATSPLKDKAVIAVFGSDEPAEKIESGLPIRWLGKISDPKKMAELYNAADVFAAPYLEDNFPSTILEAMACGTPAVAFRAGGIPDMVEHQKDGYLAETKNAADLANGLIWTLENPERYQALSQAARQRIISDFTLEKQAERYLALYQKILAKK